MNSTAKTNSLRHANSLKWLSRDPLKNAETSEGPNLYEYVGNNPINHVDPTGLFETGGMIKPGDLSNRTVCDGKGGVRPQLSDWAERQPKAIRDCIFKHEMSHVADALKQNPDICKGKPAGTLIQASTVEERNATEIKATNVELDCLRHCAKSTARDNNIKREEQYQKQFLQ